MNLAVLVPLLLDVGRAVWSTIADRDENEDRAKAIARAAMDAALAEARFQAELAGIAIAHDLLDAAMNRVLDAFNAKGTFPTLPIHIEMVSEITDEDRAREKATWDSLKTPTDRPPPEGSSDR